jgi:chromosome transmission fidelity protein 18
MSDYSQGFLSSFDPALLSDLECPSEAHASISFSDDVTALEQCQAEEKARKTKLGIVIQHRAWNITDVFRSEADYLIGTANAQSYRNWD